MGTGWERVGEKRGGGIVDPSGYAEFTGEQGTSQNVKYKKQ